MYETKLIQTYLALNKEEKRLLKKYVNIHYVKLHKDLYDFFLFFSSKKSINEHIVTKEKAFLHLYGEQTAYKDLVIRHLIWLCTQLLEEFIVEYHYDKNKISQHHILAEFYLGKQLHKYAEIKLQDGVEIIQKQKIKDNKYYLDAFHFFSNQYEISSIQNRNTLQYVNEINHHLNIYYVIELLKNATQTSSIKALNSEVTENILLEPILNYLPKSELLSNPLINIYYQTYILINNDDEVNFDNLVKNLKKYENLFSFIDINNLYKIIINYCVKKHNQNIIKYRIAGFELYIYALNKKFLYDYEHITRFIFSNVVTLGIRLNRLKDVEKFIKKYNIYIESEFRAITLAFNQAKLFYAKQEYNKAIKILMTHQFKDILWNLNMKHLLLKIYYEINELDLLKSNLKAFKSYVKRKNNIGYHQTYFKNIARAFDTLIKFKEHPQKFNKYTLDSNTPDYEWFSKMYVIK